METSLLQLFLALVFFPIIQCKKRCPSKALSDKHVRLLATSLELLVPVLGTGATPNQNNCHRITRPTYGLLDTICVPRMAKLMYGRSTLAGAGVVARFRGLGSGVMTRVWLSSLGATLDLTDAVVGADGAGGAGGTRGGNGVRLR
jgi:hypothetical protein